jgi:acyl-CoA synthetase (AMP-forming)/AMP-acid ligase II
MAMGMCYTSGTTGEPKGALYSHRSMFLHTLGESQANALGISESDSVLVVVPQFHAMAWGLPYSALAAGAELVMPGPHLKPEPLADLISQERVTMAAGVPTIWNGLYHELRAEPARHFQRAGAGGRRGGHAALADDRPMRASWASTCCTPGA